VIQGHPGLDLVIIAREVTPGGLGLTSPAFCGTPFAPPSWPAIRSLAGDDTGFCAAYGRSSYAPDLR